MNRGTLTSVLALLLLIEAPLASATPRGKSALSRPCNACGYAQGEVKVLNEGDRYAAYFVLSRDLIKGRCPAGWVKFHSSQVETATGRTPEEARQALLNSRCR